MRQRLAHLMKSDTAWFETVSAVLLLVWAIVLLLPPPTFQTSASYTAMGSLMGETAWGAMAAVCGALGLGGMVLDRDAPRAWALYGGVFFWGSVGTCIALSNPGATGGWVYLVLANACAFARLSRR